MEHPARVQGAFHMIRIFIATMLAGMAWFAAGDAQALQGDCQAAVDEAYDLWEASPALLQCAADGDAEAESVLGMIYLSAGAPIECDDDDCGPDDPASYGLSASMTPDDLNSEGIRLLRSASAKGQADAMNEIGIAYLDGTAGMQQDYALAKDWFDRATKGGDAYGPYNLARIYLFGRGVEVSSDTAENYLRMSSQRGYRVATCSLGLIVERKTTMNRILGGVAQVFAGLAGRQRCQGYEIMEELR
jgi:TPR repeat protein